MHCESLKLSSSDHLFVSESYSCRVISQFLFFPSVHSCTFFRLTLKKFSKENFDKDLCVVEGVGLCRGRAREGELEWVFAERERKNQSGSLSAPDTAQKKISHSSRGKIARAIFSRPISRTRLKIF